MTVFAVADELRNWAERAGYVFPAVSDPGTVKFYDIPGGEIRNFIRLGDDGWLTLTSANRAGDEHFEIACSSESVLTRYIWGDLGREVRSRTHLPRIKYPTRPDEIARGYRMGEYDATLDRRTLFDPHGHEVVMAKEEIRSAVKLVVVSNYLAASLDALIQSFEDPEGKPLFQLGKLPPYQPPHL